MRSGLSIIAAVIISGRTLDSEGGNGAVSSSPANAREDRIRERFTVDFSEEIRFRSRNEDLAQTCGSREKVRGCTEFPSEVLECDCYRDGAGWRLRVEARVDAVMHVDHTSIVIDERRHLLHLDELLTVWLEKMAVPVFATEPRCRAIGRLLSRPLYVTAMMNDLRMSSNLLFQCSRPGEDGQPAGLLALDEGTGWSITGALRTRIRFRRNRFRRLVQPACGVSSAG